MLERRKASKSLDVPSRYLMQGDVKICIGLSCLPTAQPDRMIFTMLS